MKILGIDPGIAICGYGLIQALNDKIEMLDCGIIKTESNKKFYYRLKELSDRVGNLILNLKPDSIAIEKLFFNKNVKTAMKISEAKGVIGLVIVNCGYDVFEYTPLQVKQAISGYGNANKISMRKMIKLLLNLKEAPKPDDAVDAIAIAICHYHSMNIKKFYDSNN